MSIALHNFLKVPYLGKFLSIHTSSDSSVNQSGSLSITPSPTAENLSKFPSTDGEKNAVSYLHEIPVKIPAVCSSSVMSVIAPISASSILSINPSDNDCQEIPDEYPSTSYGEKSQQKLQPKFLVM